MLSKKGKIVFSSITVASIVGCGITLYVGYTFFSEKKLLLILFSAYIVFMAILVIFFAYKFIKAYIF